MVRFTAMIVAVTFAGVALAQTAADPRSGPKTAVQNQEDPNDIAAVPRHVQKWIGGAVDDILSDTDKAIGQGGGKR